MKTVTLSALLALTLIGHVAIWSYRSIKKSDGVAASANPRAATDGSESEVVMVGFEEAQAMVLKEVMAKGWESLRGKSLNESVDRLRAAGFPPHVVRAIVAAEVREAHRARIDELVSQIGDYAYWDRSDVVFMPTLNREYVRLNESMQAEVAELLGGEYERDPFRDALDRRRFGKLPSELLEKVNAITGDYSDLKTNIFLTTGGIMTPEDSERLSFLEEEEARDMAELLTPEQLLDYRLRNDRSAQTLRTRLGIMNPTEEEFRAIYQANVALDERDGALSEFDWGPQANQAKEQRSEAVQAALAGTMAPDRLALLEQAMDPNLMMLNNIVSRYELQPAVAKQTMELQTSRIQEIMKLQNDQGMETSARSAALNELKTKTEAELESMLGEAGMATYRRFGGQWIDAMFAPRPAPPGGG